MGIPNQRELRYEAVGVVGAITPWNFPTRSTSPRSARRWPPGASVVLKPAPDTPWAAALVGKVIAEETDFPPGVVNVITSSDHAIGA